MTNFYLTSAAADAAVTAGSGTKWKCSTSPGASARHLNKNSVTGPTAPLQMTDGATAGTDGTAVSWYTAPLEAITIAGAITCSMWDRENAAADNVAPSIRIERCDGAGNVLSTIVSETTSFTAGEMATTASGAADAISISAANTTDTTLSQGDRLRITLWIDDAAAQGGTGNMASSGRGEFWVNGPTGAQGASQIAFAEAVQEYLPLTPQVFPFETANWTANTTPRTISVTGALTGDRIYVLYGGDNFTDAVTAATVSTVGGSTSAWTEVDEDLGSSPNQAWISAAYADVTADGTVSVSLARTKSTPQVWGGWAALVRNSAGMGNHAHQTNGAGDTVSLTVSDHSVVLLLNIDWDDVASVAFSPAGAIEVERTSGTAVAWYAGYWRDQAAGTRGYGTATNSGANNTVATAIEVLAPAGGAGITLPLVTAGAQTEPLVNSKSATVGLVTEGDGVQSLTRSKTSGLGLTTEGEAVQALTRTKAASLGFVGEGGQVQGLASNKAVSLATVQEAGQVLSLTKTKTFTLGLITEGELASPLTRSKAAGLGVAAEGGAVQPLSPTRAAALGLIQEGEQVQAVVRTKSAQFGLVGSGGEVKPLDLPGAPDLILGLITEGAAVQPLARVKSRSLGLVALGMATLGLSNSKETTLELVTEGGAVQTLTRIKSPLVLSLVLEGGAVLDLTLPTGTVPEETFAVLHRGVPIEVNLSDMRVYRFGVAVPVVDAEVFDAEG